MHGIVDEKTDIFAFGVLLLEIVTGRRPVDSSKPSLLLWVSEIKKIYVDNLSSVTVILRQLVYVLLINSILYRPSHF